MQTRRLRRLKDIRKTRCCHSSVEFINVESSSEDEIIDFNGSTSKKVPTIDNVSENCTKDNILRILTDNSREQDLLNKDPPKRKKKVCNEVDVAFKNNDAKIRDDTLQMQKENFGTNQTIEHKRKRKNDKKISHCNGVAPGSGGSGIRKRSNLKTNSSSLPYTIHQKLMSEKVLCNELMDFDSISDDSESHGLVDFDSKKPSSFTSEKEPMDKLGDGNHLGSDENDNDDQMEGVEYSVQNPELQPSYFLFHSTRSLNIDNLRSFLANEKKKMSSEITDEIENFDDLKQIIQKKNKIKKLPQGEQKRGNSSSNGSRSNKKAALNEKGKKIMESKDDNDCYDEEVRNTAWLVEFVKSQYESSLQSGIQQSISKNTCDNDATCKSSKIQLHVLINSQDRTFTVSSNLTLQHILNELSDDLPDLLPGEYHAFKFDGIFLKLDVPISGLYLVNGDTVQYCRAGNSYEYLVDRNFGGEEIDKIVLNIRTPDGQKYAFRLGRSDHLSKIVDAAVKKMEVDESRLKLNFDGEDLDVNLSPEDYDMEPGDMIDIFTIKVH